ncbi:GGDEF domain-containing protein [Marinobacter sp. SBS5]|uniref:GGDEF domain-containing protein n=1 Tax=Marinobacter sp. SBS5 TaxID=3401754 RepID=UPI003AB0218C
MLKRVSGLIQTRLRESDLIARMGGEEFVLLLPGSSAEKARQISEQLLNLIHSLGVPHKGQTIKLSASFGITTVDPND